MTVISGRENVRMASRLAQRSALGLKIKIGLRRCGRPISTILKGDADFMAWLAEAGLTLRLANALASTNPRFDRTKFLKACGFGGDK